MRVSKGWQNCHFWRKWFLDFSEAWGKAVSVEQPHLVCQISLKLEPDMTPVRNGSLHCLRGPRVYNINLISSFHPSSRWYYILGISFPPLASCLAPDDSIWLSGLSAVPGTHAGSQAVWRSITIGSQSASVAMSGPSRPALLVVGVVKSSPTPFEMKPYLCLARGSATLSKNWPVFPLTLISLQMLLHDLPRNEVFFFFYVCLFIHLYL